MTYDAILFDMDGVLLAGYETPPEVYRMATQSLLDGFGVTSAPEDLPQSLFNPGSAEEFRECCKTYGLPAEAAWAYRERAASDIAYRRLEAAEREPFDDVRVLESLSGTYDIGICSNNRHDTVRDCAALFDWAEYINTYRGRFPTLGDFDERKPKPTYLEWVIDRLEAERPVFVGDRISDVQTAAAVGCDAVLLTREGDVPGGPVEPTYRVENLEDLNALHQSGWQYA